MSHLTISEDVTQGLSNAAFKSLQERAGQYDSDEYDEVSEEDDYPDENGYDEDEQGSYHTSEVEEASNDPEFDMPLSDTWQTTTEKRKRGSDSPPQVLRTPKRAYIGDHTEHAHIPEKVYRVLHRVKCNSHTHHIFRLFEDVPIRGSIGHLNGFEPLRHQSECISKFPNTPFLIIKEHYCKPEDKSYEEPGTATANYLRSGHAYSEKGSIVVLDEGVKKTIQKVSKAYLYQGSEEEMRPPYLWLFHHRVEMEEEAVASHPALAQDIRCIVKYAKDQYGHLYSKVDDHQRNGIVDRKTMPFLFRPNQLLFSRLASTRTYDRVPTMRAFVLESWPSISENSWTLSCWFFKHNNVQATRAKICLSVDSPDEPVKIGLLPTFPLAYATAGDIETLTQRGKHN